MTKDIDGVRVERLARTLGVTKGSFYCHFKDHNDLFGSMLDYWAEALTTAVRDELKGTRGDAKQRLLRLMQVIHERGAARYDVAVRAWAAFDQRAAAVVKKVDK